MKVVCTTSNKYANKCLRQFAWTFNRFWGEHQEVIIVGENPPRYKLPDNFRFYSVSPSWPAQEFSNGIIHFLKNELSADYFLWTLDDFWLIDDVDYEQIENLQKYMEEATRPILRMDLSTDRQHSGHAEELGKWGKYTLIETPPETPYQLSLQAAIWNVELLLDVLQPGWTPWQVELNGTSVVQEKKHRVLGTLNHPFKYCNLYNVNRGYEPECLPEWMYKQFEEAGWLDNEA